MVDFLKANPFVTLEDYKWGLSVPMIRIMAIDNTRIHYISDKAKEKKQAKKTAINSAEDLFASMGMAMPDIIEDVKENNKQA